MGVLLDALSTCSVDSGGGALTPLAGEHAESLRIPERMWRPTGAGETLRVSPTVKAGWADASRVKGVPLVAAGAEPVIFLAGRPATKWALDARRFRSAGVLLFFKLAVWNDDGTISDRTHACYYALACCSSMSVRWFSIYLCQA